MTNDRCQCALCEPHFRIEGRVIPVHEGPKRDEPYVAASGLYRYMPSVDRNGGWDLVIPARTYKRNPMDGFSGQGRHRDD
jgi:hypothetical protein|tara:strand:+ start:2275 stop:2514 length:240 start_codon:yes stop_codon:yes gene_type:complete